jgi:hypothetical protein
LGSRILGSAVFVSKNIFLVFDGKKKCKWAISIEEME